MSARQTLRSGESPRVAAGEHRRNETAMTPVIGIVDDDASILRAVRRLLVAAGFTVQTFGSAEEFLASDHPERIGCLVLDIHLNGLSGFELQDRLMEAHIQIPIVFITAHDDLPTRERAQRGGASEYLRKPFDEHSLIGAIGKALGRARS
jgi:FixJ family two-component response regulator